MTTYETLVAPTSVTSPPSPAKPAARDHRPAATGATRVVMAPDALGRTLARAVRLRAATTPLLQRAAVTGTAAVTGAVATAILGNVEAGDDAFRPELGLGGCTWILTLGSPHVGIDPAKNIILNVTITYGDDVTPVNFVESTLKAIFDDKLAAIVDSGYADYREHKGLGAGPLNARQLRGAKYWARLAAEKQMWVAVGERVAASAQRVGKVRLRNSDFSKQGDGDFFVVADGGMITLDDTVEDVQGRIDAAAPAAAAPAAAAVAAPAADAAAED